MPVNHERSRAASGPRWVTEHCGGSALSPEEDELTEEG